MLKWVVEMHVKKENDKYLKYSLKRGSVDHNLTIMLSEDNISSFVNILDGDKRKLYLSHFLRDLIPSFHSSPKAFRSSYR
jgi:hypothetical protein